MLTITIPARLDLSLSKADLLKVEKFLTFKNKTAQQQYQRFRANRWYAQEHGQAAFDTEINRLKKEIDQCILFQDDKGFYTYSGLAQQISDLVGLPVINNVEYPEYGLLPWVNQPEFDLRYYQKNTVKSLLQAKHAGVEIGTGLGKSACALHLAKTVALPTLVMAPSSSIAEQLYDDFVHHLGGKRVGKCFGGTKDYKKQITIALPQTLSKLDKYGPIYKKLSKCSLFIADESHLCPAKTLADVCFGLMANAQYRFFFSATQIRNDGQDLVLDGITGPIVYRMDVREGVDQGFLAKPIFKLIHTESPTLKSSADPNELTRHYLLYNPKVNKIAADIANGFVEHDGHSVLILVDEVEQFSKLLPHLKHPVGFAHGPLGENRAKVPELYWDSDPNALVKQFNAKTLPILVGTSCISTGTDIKSVKTMIYLMGGKSEVQVKQAVGRATRRVADKTECNVFDFAIKNNETVYRHAMERKAIYESIYGPVEDIDL